MSVNIFHKTGSGTGTLQKVAGNTVILDANVSEIRNGNFSLSITSTAGYFRTTVTFATPMPDTDYIVNLEVDTADYLVSNITPLIIDQKTVNGFRINWYGQAGSGVSGVISGKYYAFKPIPMDGYTELQNKVNNPDNTPTKDSENLVKSGGVWDALKDAGTVFTGTKAEWEALDPTDQERYEVVCITDDEESGLVDEYSLDEVRTNKVWIDGKPIYRKCVSQQVDTYTDSGTRRTFSLALPGVPNVESLISTAGFWEIVTAPLGVGQKYPFPATSMGPSGSSEMNFTAYGAQYDTGLTALVQPSTAFQGGITKVYIKAAFEYTKN